MEPGFRTEVFSTESDWLPGVLILIFFDRFCPPPYKCLRFKALGHSIVVKLFRLILGLLEIMILLPDPDPLQPVQLQQRQPEPRPAPRRLRSRRVPEAAHRLERQVLLHQGHRLGR